jgi:hypothetical protein
MHTLAPGDGRVSSPAPFGDYRLFFQISNKIATIFSTRSIRIRKSGSSAIARTPLGARPLAHPRAGLRGNSQPQRQLPLVLHNKADHSVACDQHSRSRSRNSLLSRREWPQDKMSRVCSLEGTRIPAPDRGPSETFSIPPMTGRPSHARDFVAHQPQKGDR